MKYLYVVLFLLVFSGCQVVHSFEVVPTPYHMLEHGVPKTMYLTLVESGEYSLFLGNWHGVTGLLSETPPQCIGEVTDLLMHSPPHRRLGQNELSIDQIVPLMTSALRRETVPMGDREGEPIRWILSLEPLIVARGTRSEIPFEHRSGKHREEYHDFTLGSTVHLVGEKDEDELATAVFILDPYPRGPVNLHELSHWWDSISAQTRRIDLSSPTRLADLMRTAHMWRKTATGRR